MAISCDVNQKKADIACITNCFGSEEILAAKVWLLAQILMALDATYADYTLDDWKELLKEWQAMSQVEQDAAEVHALGEYAISLGVAITNDMSASMELLKCYFCIPVDTLHALEAGLICRILANLEAARPQ